MGVSYTRGIKTEYFFHSEACDGFVNFCHILTIYDAIHFFTESTFFSRGVIIKIHCAIQNESVRIKNCFFSIL